MEGNSSSSWVCVCVLPNFHGCKESSRSAQPRLFISAVEETKEAGAECQVAHPTIHTVGLKLGVSHDSF